MSLINKMLSDLDQRHNYYRNDDEMVLGDLSPISYTGFTKSRVPVNFLLICFFLTSVIIGIYAYLNGSPENLPVPFNSVNFESLENPGMPLLPERGLQVRQPVENSPLHDPGSQGLKLDLNLPVQPKPQVNTPIPPAAISSISVSTKDSRTLLELQLDSRTDYMVFTLHDPERLVVEINNAELLASLPEVLDHPYISRFQIDPISNNTTSLVVYLQEPVDLESSELLENNSGFILKLSMTGAEDLKEDASLANSRLIQAGGASNVGQMDMQQSTVRYAPNYERFINEARAFYTAGDYAGGDKTLAKLLELDPLHTQARSLFSSSLVKRGNITRAGEVLNSGLQLNPGNSEWAEMYARMLVLQGETEKAIDVLAGATPDIATSENYYALYAALLQQNSRHKQASEIYQALVKQQPGNSLWWMGLAISQNFLNMKAEAVNSFKKSLAGNTLDFELTQYVLQQIEQLSN